MVFCRSRLVCDEFRSRSEQMFFAEEFPEHVKSLFRNVVEYRNTADIYHRKHVNNSQNCPRNT